MFWIFYHMHACFFSKIKNTSFKNINASYICINTYTGLHTSKNTKSNLGQRRNCWRPLTFFFPSSYAKIFLHKKYTYKTENWPRPSVKGKCCKVTQGKAILRRAVGSQAQLAQTALRSLTFPFNALLSPWCVLILDKQRCSRWWVFMWLLDYHECLVRSNTQHRSKLVNLLTPADWRYNSTNSVNTLSWRQVWGRSSRSHGW